MLLCTTYYNSFVYYTFKFDYNINLKLITLLNCDLFLCRDNSKYRKVKYVHYKDHKINYQDFQSSQTKTTQDENV